VVTLSRPAVDLMIQLADETTDSDCAFQLPHRISGELRGVLNRYLCNLMGRKPRMHDYLGLVWK
jgi:hypothetical protein